MADEKSDSGDKKRFEPLIGGLPRFDEVIDSKGFKPTFKRVDVPPADVYGSSSWRYKKPRNPKAPGGKRLLLRLTIVLLAATATFWLRHNVLAPKKIDLPKGRYFAVTALPDSSLAVADATASSIYTVAPGSTHVSAPLSLANPSLTGLAYFKGAFWSADYQNQNIYAHDVKTLTIQKTFPLPSIGKIVLSAAGEHLWSADPLGQVLNKMSLSQDRLKTVATYLIKEHYLSGLAVNGDTLWLLDADKKTINRYHAGDDSLEPEGSQTVENIIPRQSPPTGLTYDGRHLWISANNPPALYRLDPF
ncbi:MAG: hypothetical protein AABZ44_04090 [Elusimicrobiota bacterium]